MTAEPRPHLPEPVRRFADLVHPGGAPENDTVLLEGHGRFRQRPLPWLPMRVRVHVVPGHARVMDILVTIGPLTLLRVLDAFVDGRGITKAIGSADVGPKIDQGAFHALVIETMLYPWAWSRLDARWEPHGETAARLLVPFAGGTEEATVSFDPESALPASYEVPRYKGTGPKVDWRVDLLEWRRFGPVWSPGRTIVTWADEPGPWFDMRVGRALVDVDVSDALNRARAALDAAT